MSVFKYDKSKNTRGGKGAKEGGRERGEERKLMKNKFWKNFINKNKRLFKGDKTGGGGRDDKESYYVCFL